MPRCDLTGKKTLVGNNVSHSNQKTKKYLLPNLQVKTFFIPELKRKIRLRVSTRALRTINKKGGLYKYIQELERAGARIL